MESVKTSSSAPLAPVARQALSARPAAPAKPAPPVQAAATPNFEIQKFIGGRWVLDSVADGKNLAIKMAKTLITSQHAPSAVQVMAVRQTGDGQFKEARIYHITLEDVQKATALARAAALHAKTKAQIDSQRQDAAHTGRASTPAPGKTRALRAAAWALPTSLGRIGWRTWVGIGVVVAWCAVFYIWHQPQSKWAFDLPAAQVTAKQRLNFP